MHNIISGIDRDTQGFVTTEATMLLERRGRRWWDVEHNAPVKAVRAMDGSIYIIGDDELDWDGPCFGGEFLLDPGEAERIGMPVTAED